MTSLAWRIDVSYYVYIFLGVLAGLVVLSILGYCIHQRRVHRFAQRDNTNNNMQRHSLIDRSAASRLQDEMVSPLATDVACSHGPHSYVEAGEVEWQCSICYHENHPAKRECLMCGTPEGDLNLALCSTGAMTV